jgi:hypothetical protein
MQAYKWLKQGAVDPDRDSAWPPPQGGPGDWTKLGGLFGAKSYAVGPDALPWDIQEEFWEVELQDPVDARPDEYGPGALLKVPPVRLHAKRGRLLRRVTDWNDSSALALAVECRTRIQHHAAVALRSTADRAERTGNAAGAARVREAADRLEGAGPEELREFASRAATEAHAAAGGHDPVGGSVAELLEPMGGDLGEANAWMAASAGASVAALAAGLGAGGTALAQREEPQAVQTAQVEAEREERARQAQWLMVRLGL